MRKRARETVIIIFTYTYTAREPVARRGTEAAAALGGRADGNFALDISLIPGHGAVCSCHGEHGAPARRAAGGRRGEKK